MPEIDPVLLQAGMIEKPEKKFEEPVSGQTNIPDISENHEPPDTHPRFKEIYGKMKGFERGLSEKDEQIKALTEHNTSLAKAVDEIDTKMSDTTRPDPTEAPEEYEAWVTKKVMKTVNQGVKVPKIPDQSTSRLVMQEQIMASLHEDFHDVLNIVGEEMKTNEFLREEIMTHANPPKKMYDYYQRKKQNASQETTLNLERGQLEGGGYEQKNKPKITSNQKTMAANLGLTEEVYMRQVDFINKRGY